MIGVTRANDVTQCRIGLNRNDVVGLLLVLDDVIPVIGTNVIDQGRRHAHLSSRHVLAQWCAPCKAFSPGMNTYQKLVGPGFWC